MEEIKSSALITFTGTAPSHWLRYVDDTSVTTRTGEVEAFTEHIKAVDNNIRFTREDVRGDSLPFLDCAVHFEEDRSPNIEVKRKPKHREQYSTITPHWTQVGGYQNPKPAGWDHAH